MKNCNKNLLKVLDEVHKLIIVADIGDLQRNDTECGELYCLIREKANRIKELTEKEIKYHKKVKMWNND
ncbi:MAG: hypothetical protein PVI26_04455 [Chitinispirillia bacterium]|jgi:hypothetical protein